jgi:hypothetical protein
MAAFLMVPKKPEDTSPGAEADGPRPGRPWGWVLTLAVILMYD